MATQIAAPMMPGRRVRAPARWASVVRLSAWNPTRPPPIPAATLAAPAARSSRFRSMSRSVTSSIPVVFRSSVRTPTTSTVPIPTAWARTAPQSAPPRASIDHGRHSPPEGNGPISHPPALAPSTPWPEIRTPT